MGRRVRRRLRYSPIRRGMKAQPFGTLKVWRDRRERSELAPRTAAVLWYGEDRRCEIGSRSRSIRTFKP